MTLDDRVNFREAHNQLVRDYAEYLESRRDPGHEILTHVPWQSLVDMYREQTGISDVVLSPEYFDGEVDIFERFQDGTWKAYEVKLDDNPGNESKARSQAARFYLAFGLDHSFALVTPRGPKSKYIGRQTRLPWQDVEYYLNSLARESGMEWKLRNMKRELDGLPVYPSDRPFLDGDDNNERMHDIIVELLQEKLWHLGIFNGLEREIDYWNEDDRICRADLLGSVEDRRGNPINVYIEIKSTRNGMKRIERQREGFYGGMRDFGIFFAGIYDPHSEILDITYQPADNPGLNHPNPLEVDLSHRIPEEVNISLLDIKRVDEMNRLEDKLVA